MRFFVYEFVTGGGWWNVDASQLPDGGLFREGAAMVQALATDLLRIGTVSVMRDTRCTTTIPGAETHTVASIAEEHERFCELVRQADWTVVIAPEFDGHLFARCQWVEQHGSRLLSPSSVFVSIASDKHRTAELLERAGIPVPRGFLLTHDSTAITGFQFPAVLKPSDGAGSLNVRLVSSWLEAQSFVPRGAPFRLEEFCSGSPASVAVLSGPSRCLVLPASSQQLTDDGRFQYLGGTTPMSEHLCRRGERLARAVAQAMPATCGYFGVDLIFGPRDDGSQDVVIEVNPRLTTSYLGLRKIAHGNLAEAMFSMARGEQVELSFDARPVQFSACTGLE